MTCIVYNNPISSQFGIKQNESQFSKKREKRLKNKIQRKETKKKKINRIKFN